MPQVSATVVSLALDNIPLFLSEEYSSVKPNPLRFVEIERRWPGLNYAYVGDNEEKDFIAANSLGWLTCGARWVVPRVHQPVQSVLNTSLPAHWADDPAQILDLIAFQ